MRFIYGLLAVNLWSSFAVAGTASSYLDMNLRESRYFSAPESSVQNNGYTMVSGDLSLEMQSAGFNYKLNPVVQGTFEAQDEFYFGMPELYVQPRKIAPGFNLTIGRAKRLWSRLDEEFNLGVWQPQLRWDYLVPQQEGLTGVFFDWSLSSAVRFSFFTSPVYIPDQGPQYRLRNGQFSSSNRWFAQPSSRLGLFQSSEAPLYFEIAKPAEEEIFMHSSFGFSMYFQSSGPFWSQFSYAFKPRNQIHLGIECPNCFQLPTSSASQGEATAVIHPKIINHNVVTWESGFDRVDDRGWISLTGDFPQASGYPRSETWAESGLSPLLIAGFAYQHYVHPWMGIPSWLEYSYMRVFELKRQEEMRMGGEDVESSLDRYPFQELAAIDWRLVIKQAQSDRVHWRNRYSYSIPERGGWLSSTLEWVKGPLTWSLGLDILGSEVGPNSEGAGLFSRYRANDRVFGGVNYVF